MFESATKNIRKKMAGGVILENLSGKKLFVLVSLLLLCQLACFLIGGLVGTVSTPVLGPLVRHSASHFFHVDNTIFLFFFAAPPLSATDSVLASKCMYNRSNPWSYIRGAGKCIPHHQDLYKDNDISNSVADEIVFIFQVCT